MFTKWQLHRGAKWR